MKPLRDVLLRYDMALLEAIAASREVVLAESDRLDAADALCAALTEPSSLAYALARLGHPARQALRSLMAVGGRQRAALWERRWGELRPFGPGRLRREAPWRQPTNVTERLWYLGLISRAFDKEGDGTREYVFIPDELQPAVVQWLGNQGAAGVESLGPGSAAPPAMAVSAGRGFAEAALAALTYTFNARVRVSAGGRLHREDLAAWREYVGRRAGWAEADEPFALLHLLLRDGGLLGPEAGRLRPQLAAARPWLETPVDEALAVLQRAWLETLRWNDLWRVSTLRCERTGWMNDPRQARQAVCALLGQATAGAWYAVHDLVDALQGENPDFQRPDGDYDSWFIRDAGSGQYLRGFESWPLVEGALVRYLLTGPLHWLGVVDLDGESQRFSLSPVGTALLSGDARPAVGPPEPARWAEPLLLELPPESSLLDRFQLARLAEWQESEPPRRYRLTASSVGRGLRQRLQVE
ncbi:MAG: hypothetical protein GX605_02435, partial [Chloroflexi bacterium]|nr:hypothetical protein [Chloroflexota bacterium]